MRVFAGPRDDAFYFDSGATFDTLNFRAPAPVLSGSADTGQGAAAPAAVDGFAGYNISLIAVEMPITMVTSTGAAPTSATDPNGTIGAWASTLRQIVTVRPSPNDPIGYGDWMQVDRVGNPLTVEALIPPPMKDRWNRSLPVDDQQWAPYIGDPFFATGILKGVFSLPVPPAPRKDLLGVFVPDMTRVNLLPRRLRSPARIAWDRWAAIMRAGHSAGAGRWTTWSISGSARWRACWFPASPTRLRWATA